MPTPKLTREQAQEAVTLINEALAEGYKRGGSPSAVTIAYARWAALPQNSGKALTTFESRLRVARDTYGILPEYPFEVVRRSETRNADGEIRSTSETSAPARGAFIEPDGMRVKKLSVLTDSQGQLVQQWRKYDENGGVTPDRLAEIIKEALESVDAAAPATPAPMVREDLANLIPATDVHMGMSAWGEETGGDYDLKIARQSHVDATHDLVSRLPAAALGIVLNLGDQMHANDSSNKTPANKHDLDVAARYAQAMAASVQMEIDRIEIAKTKHREIVYRIIKGNHDPDASVGVAMALLHHYRLDPRVTVDANPSGWWFFPWGSTLFGATHGHDMKPQKMKSYMADACRKLWGQTRKSYIFYGHNHEVKAFMDGSTHVECLGNFAPRDGYAAPKFSDDRIMQALTFHSKRGSIGRQYFEHVPEDA